MTLMERGNEHSEGSSGGNIWPWTIREWIQGTYIKSSYTDNGVVGDKLFDDIILDASKVPGEDQLTNCLFLKRNMLVSIRTSV